MAEVSENSTPSSPASPLPTPEALQGSPLQEAASQGAPSQGAPSQRTPEGRSWGTTLLVVAALAAGLGGYRYLVAHSGSESTDDAFVEGHVIAVSPQVSGTVTKVLVHDNEAVKKGTLLLEIDPRSFEARVTKARAALVMAQRREQSARSHLALTDETTKASLSEAASAVEAAQSRAQTFAAETTSSGAQLAQAQARIREATQRSQGAEARAAQAQALLPALEAEATRAAHDQERFEKLLVADEVSLASCERMRVASREAAARLASARHAADAARADAQQAHSAEQAMRDNAASQQAELAQSQARVREAEANVRVAQGRLAAARTAPTQVAESRSQEKSALAGVSEAQAALRQAELELSYCHLTAPSDGFVTRKSIDEGAYVQPGQSLMAIVRPDVWVVANFKETQLRQMKVGQKATVRVDAYPDRHLQAHIDSIQAGTGARFSLLPAENSTGNFVKVVQRVPVKLVFDEPLERLQGLGPGMSVEPEVQVR